MKTTGIVRRIDDLGRVVIPKEIRRTMRIREGDPVEIFTGEGGTITLKKFSAIGEMSSLAQDYADTLAQITGHIVCISDDSHIVAAAGSSAKHDYLYQKVSELFVRTIKERIALKHSVLDQDFVEILAKEKLDCGAQIIVPIFSNGDVIGAVIILTKSKTENLDELDLTLAHAGATFLGKISE